MCGRYKLSKRKAEWTPQFDVEFEADVDDYPRYNIAPTQSVWTVRQPTDSEKREAVRMRWGLIPFWAKDVSIGYKMINARCETVLEKPAFRDAFKKRRCLIPADGFYEWKKEKYLKQPFNFRMKDDSVFAFAGLWERWKAPDGQHIESCTILTTQPNELLTGIHDRMPVILQTKDYSVWLNSALVMPDELCELLVPFNPDAMKKYPVSIAVNNARHDAPDCCLAG